MKKSIFFLLFFLAIALCSCSKASSSFTPELVFSYFYVNPIYEGEQIVDAEDTLLLSVREDCYVLDTIDQEDTVVVAVAFHSFANELIAARVNFDTLQLNMCAKIPAEGKIIMLPETDYRNLQFYINPGYNTLYIPFGYRALQSGSHKFTFVVESDSKFSPTQITYCQPVR